MSRKDRMNALDEAIGGLAAQRKGPSGAARSLIPIVNQIESVFTDSAAELERLRRDGHVLLELDPAEIVETAFRDRHAAAFADPAFEDLVQDMLRQGQMVPVLVRPRDGGRYELIAGHRRLAAARRLGRPVLARVLHADDRALVIKMVRENEAREDISPFERAVQLKTVLDRGLMSRAEVMQDLGMSKGHLSNLLKFAELPEAVVSALGDPRLLRIADGARLSRLLADPAALARVLAAADGLAGSSLGFAARLKALFAAAGGQAPTLAGEAKATERVIRSRTGQVLVRLSEHDGRPILRLAAGLPGDVVERMFDQLPGLLKGCGLDVE